MTPARRWSSVAVAVALLGGVPLGLRALPVADSPVAAGALLDRIEGSSGVSYSGYVETLGSLDLPVADRFTDVGELFGERTRLRVWWRGSEDWRVDKVLATGEEDLFHTGSRTLLWDYEASRVTLAVDPDIRLPRASDLLPPQLAKRLLAGAELSEVSRLPTERIAGRTVPGLRLTPAAPQSSIDHVDVWADPESGLAVRVAVFAKGDDSASLTSTFESLSLSAPSSETTRFTVPPDADVEHDNSLDIAATADEYSPMVAPTTLAGLRSSQPGLGAVGVYGAGLTQLIAIPLWDDAAEPLREQLRLTPGARRTRVGDALRVGPLNVLLTEVPGVGAGWLVAGTVNDRVLVRAGLQLDTGYLGMDGVHR